MIRTGEEKRRRKNVVRVDAGPGNPGRRPGFHLVVNNA